MKILTLVVDSLIHSLPAGSTIISAHYNGWHSVYTICLWVTGATDLLDYEFRVITEFSELEPGWTQPVLVQNSSSSAPKFVTWRYVK